MDCGVDRLHTDVEPPTAAPHQAALPTDWRPDSAILAAGSLVNRFVEPEDSVPLPFTHCCPGGGPSRSEW
jgi:hypothetical protein